ncbi:protein-methionine-sulfoxide reductase catalytic subunit MsrP [Pedosphaera parvula]|uniref:Oxidoreductase molybdopterin binding n=1 Tax=Pedosphaera parvula (strain Ellin514) TaxID=320771 RepID=B9XIV1_PEDPL|nr:protein-methionine-sulfoxide reductase catalytic subunit MsrP [Pedosphaera parvula]EEF60178.1 oxidoreductase molybdopterin binding [Pedosphaera parvula Ellin514]
MANIIKRPGWHIPEKLVTPESLYWNRRSFLKQMGFLGAGILSSTMIGCSKPVSESGGSGSGVTTGAVQSAKSDSSKYPAPRNPEFNPGWPLTNEKTAATYNNFYEFSTVKDRVHKLTDKFVTSPWPIQIGGLIEKPMKVDVQEMIEMMTLEERVYRFRCVEAWAMIVPWTGFPLKKLLDKIAPKSGARFVRFETFNRPDQAPGIARLSDYPWPYTEGLRLEEAMNPLTMVVTGIYGKPLPKQHGAPIRIIVPWKYGYKSIKSIVKIDLVETQPATLWETLAPSEYPFESNVNPAVPHPRWSQATERMIDSGDLVKTEPFNGYGKYVENLYKKV